MRQRFIWVEGRGLVEVPADYRPPPRRFHIGRDTTEPFKSMADGKHYDSKSRYRAEIKARGFEELGNEMSECVGGKYEPLDYRDDLAETASEYGVNLGSGEARDDG
jgi:hypothetical protein